MAPPPWLRKRRDGYDDTRRYPIRSVRSCRALIAFDSDPALENAGRAATPMAYDLNKRTMWLGPMRKWHSPKKPWSMVGMALLGGFLGMGLAVLHCGWHIFHGRFPDENPFIHMLLDLLAGSLGVGSLFASIAGFRNWLVERK